MPPGRTLILGFLLSVPGATQQWPMYLRDLAHSSFVPGEKQLDKSGISNLQRTWQLSLAANLAAAPTFSKGILYFGDWGGYFHAVNAQTGTQLWQTFVGKSPNPSEPFCDPGIGVSSQATVLGTTVYVGGGDSAVYALDLTTGAQLWRLPLADPATGSYIWSSIVPYNNALYVGLASQDDCPVIRGAVVRIDPQKPDQPLIRYLMAEGASGAGVWSTPAIDQATNTLFVTTGNGDDPQDVSIGNYTEAALSLDAGTLEVQSYYLLPEAESEVDVDWGSSATLFTSGGISMIAATGKDGMLYALERPSLRLAWETYLAVGCSDPTLGCGSVSTPAYDGTTLFVGAGVRDPNGDSSGSVYAIRPADGSVIWVRDTAGTVIAPVTVSNGLLFVSTTEGLEIYHAATGQILWDDRKRGPIYSQPVVVDGTIYSTYVSGDVIAWQIPPADTSTLYSFSAASGLPSFGPAGIASAYGTGLDGASVTVEDSTGTVYPAQVLFSSSNQINYLVPDAAAGGRGAVNVITAAGNTLSTALQISDVAPGIFSANGDAKGVAAAQVLLTGADGSQQFVPVAQCGADPGSCIAQPVDMMGDQGTLVLYGTGIRGLSSMDNVWCTIGGVAAPVLYAGPQNGFAGLDQVNVAIPAELAGRGEVDVVLSVDGQLANTVTVSFK